MTRGSLEAKLPTIWTDEQQRWEESEKRREKKRREKKKEKRKEERRSEKIREDQRRSEKMREEKESEERVRRKKLQAREKVEKSQNILFFQRFVAPEGWKIGSLKPRVQSHLAGWEMKNCTPL